MHPILPFVSKPQKRNPGYGTGYGESQSGGIFLSVNTMVETAEQLLTVQRSITCILYYQRIRSSEYLQLSPIRIMKQCILHQIGNQNLCQRMITADNKRLFPLLTQQVHLLMFVYIHQIRQEVFQYLVHRYILRLRVLHVLYTGKQQQGLIQFHRTSQR